MTSVAQEVIADPVGLVVRLVGEVERRLDTTRIREIVCEVVRERAGRRSLAQALRDDPSLLRTGRPPAAYCVAKLLMALREAGAQEISPPHCGQCGRARPWVGSQRGGQWACSPCSDKPAVCAGCGELRRVVSRDRAGEPRCAHCPDTAGDPLAALIDQVTGLDPALDTKTVLSALGRATVPSSRATTLGVGRVGTAGPADRRGLRRARPSGTAVRRRARRGGGVHGRSSALPALR